MTVGDRPLRVGSTSDCDLVLPDHGETPGEHFLLWRHGASLILHVTAGDAPCFVNGRRTTWASLEAGDVIEVGGAELRVELIAD